MKNAGRLHYDDTSCLHYEGVQPDDFTLYCSLMMSIGSFTGGWECDIFPPPPVTLPHIATRYHTLPPEEKKNLWWKCPRNWPFFDIPQGTTGVLFMVPELTTTGFEA